MDITPLVTKGNQIVEAYGDGGFRISGQAFTVSVYVSSTGVKQLPSVILSDMTETLFADLFEGGADPELLLIGTGKSMELFSSAIRAWLRARGIALEVMDTGAACRTYNVLLSEGRRVSALLIPV